MFKGNEKTQCELDLIRIISVTNKPASVFSYPCWQDKKILQDILSQIAVRNYHYRKTSKILFGKKLNNNTLYF